MSVVSLFANGEILALDATKDVNYSRGAEVTSSTIFSGAEVSDGYRPTLPQVSLSGVVTATKTRSSESGVKSPSELRSFLDTWVESQYLVSMYGTDDSAIPNLSNMVIADFNVGRTVRHSDGLTVSILLKQIDISTSVRKTSVTVPKTATNGLTTEPSNNTPEGKTTENTEQTDKTVALQLLELESEVDDLEASL